MSSSWVSCVSLLTRVKARWRGRDEKVKMKVKVKGNVKVKVKVKVKVNAFASYILWYVLCWCEKRRSGERVTKFSR